MKDEIKVVKVVSDRHRFLGVFGGATIITCFVFLIAHLSMEGAKVLEKERIVPPEEIRLSVDSGGYLLCSLKPLPEAYSAESVVALFDGEFVAVYHCATDE